MNAVNNDMAVSGDPRIAVIGVGGAGCKIASMLYGKMSRVGVIAINTDKASLEETPADLRLYICKEVTKGLGTNGDPALGKKCAQIHAEKIQAAVSSYDCAYIVTGLGGGTGSGAASVIAELCDRANVSVGAIAIMPFSFESGRAVKAADGYRALHAVCPTVLRIENDMALKIKGIRTFDEAMQRVNESIVDELRAVVEDSRNAARIKVAEAMVEENSSAIIDVVRQQYLRTEKSN